MEKLENMSVTELVKYINNMPPYARGSEEYKHAIKVLGQK